MRKAFTFLVLLLIVLACDLAWRARPTMGPKESYNALFPKEKFLAKLASPVPEWMALQLASDFKDTTPITAPAIEKAYATILSRVPERIFCYHYRILDNQLYKHIPPHTSCSPRDTFFERAFKTLLSHAKIPDIDFILIPMDGIPESFMAPDFYLLDDPREQVPIFGQAKLKEPLTRSIVLIPDQLTLSDSWYSMAQEILSLNDTIPWAQKQGKAFWRGGVSDNGVSPGKSAPTLIPTPRLNLCRQTKTAPALLDALFCSCECPLTRQLIGEEELLTSTFASKKEHLSYRYQPALDGHMCTYPGFQWRLLSDTLTLKQESDQIQWFYSALKPYQHYLPLASDMSDIVEKVNWAETHPQETRAMIANARAFAANNLLYEDCYRYLHLAFHTYATRQQIDFKSLKQQTKSDPHWINIHYRKRAAVYKMLQRALDKIKSYLGFSTTK